MVDFTFEQLPQAITQLFSRLENIERLLTDGSSQQPQDTERWLNLSELCEYMPDKPVKATVYGWVHKMVIPCHRRGKKLYFLKSEIDAWLKTGRKKTIAETASEADTYLNTKHR